MISFDPSTNTLSEHPFSYESLTMAGQSPSLLEHSGLLKVWFLLIDRVEIRLPAFDLKYNLFLNISRSFSICPRD